MASRFWLSGTAFTVVNPGTIGTWGSDSLKTIKYLWGDAPPDDDSFGTITVNMTGAYTSLHRQYISAPMAAGVVFNGSTTWTLAFQFSESSTSANAYGRFHVAIVSEDGNTVRAEFSSGEKDGTEFGTSLAGRVNVNTGGIVYTTVAGDRLVLEHGVDKDASGTYGVTYRYGNTGANDLSSTEGDTGSTDNPWFECSTTISFDVGGEDPPPTFNEDYNCTTFIGAVLDDYL